MAPPRRRTRSINSWFGDTPNEPIYAVVDFSKKINRRSLIIQPQPVTESVVKPPSPSLTKPQLAPGPPSPSPSEPEAQPLSSPVASEPELTTSFTPKPPSPEPAVLGQEPESISTTTSSQRSTPMTPSSPPTKPKPTSGEI